MLPQQVDASASPSSVSLESVNTKVTELEGKLNQTYGNAFTTKEGSKVRKELRKETEKLNEEIKALAKEKIDSKDLKQCADLRIKLDKINSRISSIDRDITNKNETSTWCRVLKFLGLTRFLEKEIKPINFQEFAMSINKQRQVAVEKELETQSKSPESLNEKITAAASVLKGSEKLGWITKSEDGEETYTLHYRQGDKTLPETTRVFSLDVGYFAPDIDRKQAFQSLDELVKKANATALSTATSRLQENQANSLQQYHDGPGYPKNKQEVEAQFTASHDAHIPGKNLYALVKETDGTYSLYLRPANPTESVTPLKLEITEVGKIKVGDTVYNNFDEIKSTRGLSLNEDTISQALQKKSKETLERDSSFNVGSRDKDTARATLQKAFDASDKTKGFYFVWKDAQDTFHLSRITSNNTIYHHEIRLHAPPGDIMVGSFTDKANDIQAFATKNQLGTPKGLTQREERIEDGKTYFDTRPGTVSDLGKRATEALKKPGAPPSCYAVKHDPATNKVELHIFPKQTSFFKTLFSIAGYSTTEIPTFEIQSDGRIFNPKDNRSFDKFSELIVAYNLSETPFLSAIEEGFNTLQENAKNLGYPFQTKSDAEQLVRDAKSVLGDKAYSQTCVIYEENGQLQLIHGKNTMTLVLREDGSLVSVSGSMWKTQKTYSSIETLITSLDSRPIADIQAEIKQRKDLLAFIQGNKKVYCRDLNNLQQVVALFGKDANGMFAFEIDNASPQNIRLHYVENGELKTKSIDTTSPTALKELANLQGDALIDKLKELSKAPDLLSAATNTFSTLRSNYETIQKVKNDLATHQTIYAAKETEAQKRSLDHAVRSLGSSNAHGGYILCEHPTEKGLLKAYMQDDKGVHEYTFDLKKYPGELFDSSTGSRYSTQTLENLGFKHPFTTDLKPKLDRFLLEQKGVLDGNQNIPSLADEKVSHWAQRASILGDHAKNVWFTRKEAQESEGSLKTFWSYATWAASGFKSSEQEEKAQPFYLDIMTRKGTTMSLTEYPITITPPSPKIQYKVTGKNKAFDSIEELVRSLVAEGETAVKVEDLETKWKQVDICDKALERQEIEPPSGKTYDDLLKEANAFDKHSHYVINKKREPSEKAVLQIEGTTSRETGLIDDKIREISWIQGDQVKIADIDITKEPGKFWARWDGKEESFDTLEALVTKVCGRDCTSAKAVLEKKKEQDKAENAQRLQREKQELQTKRLDIVALDKTQYVLIGDTPQARLQNLESRVTNAAHLSTDIKPEFNQQLCENILQHILQKGSYTDDELLREYNGISDPHLKLLFVKIAAAASSSFSTKLPKIPLSHYVVAVNYGSLGNDPQERLKAVKDRVQNFDVDEISQEAARDLVLAIMDPAKSSWPSKISLKTLKSNCDKEKDPNFVALKNKAFG